MVKKSIWISALLALFFLAVMTLVLTDALAGFESWVYQLLQQTVSPPMTAVMKIASWLGNPSILALISLALLLLPATRVQYATRLVPSVAVAGLFNQILKRVFQRQRPGVIAMIHESGFSFPSGHSMGSAAIGAALVIAACRIQQRWPRRILCGLGVLFPLFVGISRIYVGVHYAGDVLGGWSLGVLTAILICALRDQIAKAERLMDSK